MTPQEIHGKLVVDIRAIDLLRRLHELPILRVALLPVPAAGGVVGDVLAEAPVARRLAHLPPFADVTGVVAGFLEDSGQRVLVLRLGLAGRRIGQAARPEGIPARVDLAPGRSAQRGRVAPLEPDAAGRQGVDVGGPVLVAVGAIAAGVIQAPVIPQNEDDVGLGERTWPALPRATFPRGPLKDTATAPAASPVLRNSLSRQTAHNLPPIL